MLQLLACSRSNVRMCVVLGRRTGTDAAGEFRRAEPETSVCKWTVADDAAKIKDLR